MRGRADRRGRGPSGPAAEPPPADEEAQNERLSALVRSGPPELLEIGRIDKPHGLRGEVVVSLISNRPQRLAPGTVLHADGRALEVVASRSHQHRWIVELAGVLSREAADVLHGARLRAAPKDEDAPDELWVHRLIGMEVVEIDGTRRGSVVALEANPASDLLVLDDGGLVPLTFVVSHDDRVVIDPPAGLFE